jgi:hypothetical protein
MKASVFLAWYHTGYTDDAPRLLAVCDSDATAGIVIAEHQWARDEYLEYEGKARWWTKELAVRTIIGATAAGETAEDGK